MQEEMKIFESGAASSAGKPGYWMIPFVVLRALAERFDVGAQKYLPHNWKKGSKDPAFIRDRFNHMIEHAFKFLEGGDAEDTQVDSIIAVLWNAMALTYWSLTEPAAVSAAFPTQAPAANSVKALDNFVKAVQGIVPETADPTPRRDAVAFKPRPPAPQQQQRRPQQQQPQRQQNSKLPDQKVPLPKDHGNSQFC